MTWPFVVMTCNWAVMVALYILATKRATAWRERAMKALNLLAQAMERRP